RPRSEEAAVDLAADAPCSAGKFCRGGACVFGCEIDGGFLAPGAQSPATVCQSCQPMRATDRFTAAADGLACSNGGGNFCIGGQCAPACEVDGGLYAPGHVDPAAACFTCQPAIASIAFTPITGLVPTGAQCASTEDICEGGACTAGCFIGGAVQLPGDKGVDGGSCCAPHYATAAWTPQWVGPTVPAGAGVDSVLRSE